MRGMQYVQARNIRSLIRPRFCLPTVGGAELLSGRVCGLGREQQQARRGASTATATPAKHPSATARNSDPNAVCVVVGASRGIGLAITQQLFRRFKGRVITLCRRPDEAGALSALFQFNPHRMTLVPIDTTDEQSVAGAAAAVKEATGGRVDVLIHTVGILHDKREGGTGAMPETSLGRVNVDFLQRNILVNSVGPLLVFKHFSPMLATTRKEDRVSPSVLATITARVGSIEDNHLGGWISYRASKAAHNQILRTASIELGRRGVTCVALHPGTVNTDLSVPFQKNVPDGKLFAVDDAATMLLDVIDSVGPEDNGSFLDYKRERIPW
jgi:NAD(P)-dependent dehydrogenase (short-subunit alcohol dehydrogenase family)